MLMARVKTMMKPKRREVHPKSLNALILILNQIQSRFPMRPVLSAWRRRETEHMFGSYCCFFMIVILISACTSKPDRPDDNNDFGAVYEVELPRFFEGIDSNDATFVVLEGQGEKNSTKYNAARAGQRFIPASTFKIPNTIIALELGIADNKDFTLPYDSLAPRGEGFWSSVWSQDHTLQSAINHSVYWYYQELARRAGEEQMRSFLEKFDYGNRNMDGGVDRFWLHGGLRISPDEQVRFLN